MANVAKLQNCIIIVAENDGFVGETALMTPNMNSGVIGPVTHPALLALVARSSCYHFSLRDGGYALGFGQQQSSFVAYSSPEQTVQLIRQSYP